jgi:hypothetical protein
MEAVITGAELFRKVNEQVRQTATSTRTRCLFGTPYAIEGELTNNSEKVTEGRIKFKLLDKEGRKIGEASDCRGNVKPGDTWHYKALIPIKSYASFELVELHW